MSFFLTTKMEMRSTPWIKLSFLHCDLNSWELLVGRVFIEAYVPKLCVKEKSQM